MAEKEKHPIIEKFARLFLKEALSGFAKPAERLAKRVARGIGLILAGLVIAVLGIAFVAVGAVKWLALLMPGWLAWLLVGIILVLLGITVTSVTYSSRG